MKTFVVSIQPKIGHHRNTLGFTNYNCFVLMETSKVESMSFAIKHDFSVNVHFVQLWDRHNAWQTLGITGNFACGDKCQMLYITISSQLFIAKQQFGIQ